MLTKTDADAFIINDPCEPNIPSKSEYSKSKCNKYNSECKLGAEEEYGNYLIPEGDTFEVAFSTLWSTTKKPLPLSLTQETQIYFNELKIEFAKWLEKKFALNDKELKDLKWKVYNLKLEITSEDSCQIPSSEEFSGSPIASTYMAYFDNEVIYICSQLVRVSVLRDLEMAGLINVNIDNEIKQWFIDNQFHFLDDSMNEYKREIREELVSYYNANRNYTFKNKLKFVLLHELTHALVVALGEKYADCMATAFMRDTNRVEFGVWDNFRMIISDMPSLLGEYNFEQIDNWHERFSLFDDFNNTASVEYCQKYKTDL